MMVASTNWESAANIALACRATGMTPMIRLGGQPWSAAGNFGFAADVERAFSIGYQSIMISLASPEEVEVLVRSAEKRAHYLTWNRRFSPPVGPVEKALDQELIQAQRETLVFPMIESRNAWERLDEILSVKDLQAVMLGMGDLSRELLGTDALVPGYSRADSDYMKIIETAMMAGRKYNVPVFANFYTRRDTPEQFVKKARWAADLGMPLIFLDFPSSVVMVFYETMIALMRKEFGET
jgi:2-keto-3-deoxy-L-rhamnonate aldolase RhmA